MAAVKLIEHDDASPEVRAVYDDIMATRKTDYINNFWKALAAHPETLRRTWESIKDVMAPGALEAQWQSAILASGSNGGIPRPAMEAIRVYHRDFYLSSPDPLP